MKYRWCLTVPLRLICGVSDEDRSVMLVAVVLQIHFLCVVSYVCM